MGQNEDKERNRTRRSQLAGYFFDVSKLAFAGLGLGGLSPIVTGETGVLNWVSVVVGLLVMVTFAVLAN